MRRKILLILFVSLVTYLIGNERVSLWDRDEPRYAQTSRQMLQSGDWVVPRFYDAVRTAKPVLIYWCQAASMAVLGDCASAARLPSAMAMTLTLAVLAITIGGRRGLWTVFVLASSLLVFWAAKSALTDAVLLLFVTIAQLCLYAIWRGNRSWRVVTSMAAAMGLGALTKGPAALLFPAMTAATLWCMSPQKKAALRSSRYAVVRVVVAIAIIAVIVGPWLYLVETRSPGFLSKAIGKEVVDRARNPQEGHAGPPGYYLVTIWAMFFPWSLLLPATLITAWRRRHLPQVRFALAAIIGPWIVLELIRTKLPHYVLPVYPFLAFLTADLLIRAGRGVVKDLARPAFVRVIFGWAVLVGFVGIAPWAALYWFPVSRVAMFSLIILSLLAIEYGRNVYVSFRAKQPLIAAMIMGAGMFAIVIVLHSGFLPAADFLGFRRA
jgi:4-amino-4-deoxy-L-arabinose transferase-like glycosyltransferase